MDILSIDTPDPSDWFSPSELQEVAEADALDDAPRDYESDPDATDELWSEFYAWTCENFDPDAPYADLT